MKIFISYRRDDSADTTGRISEYLANEFGEEFVFKDVDSIPLGTNFRHRMKQALDGCDVVLAIIGRDWAGKTPSGGPRLDQPDDYVRAELEEAIAKAEANPAFLLIPVLVHGASMPQTPDLPPTLQPLCARNATQVRPDPDFRIDIQRIIATLRQTAHAASVSNPRGKPSAVADQFSQFLPLTSIAFLAVIALIVVGVFWGPGRETMRSEGNNSPIVNAHGGDVTVNVGQPEPAKPELISSHDGAGALLMTEPDFTAFIGASIGQPSEKIIGRLLNGTHLSDLKESREQSSDSPPWIKVRVLDGKFKDQEGWLIYESVKRP